MMGNFNKMTNEDVEYRQGRTKKQSDDSERLMFISSLGLGVVILGIVIWGILGG